MAWLLLGILGILLFLFLLNLPQPVKTLAGMFWWGFLLWAVWRYWPN